MSRSIVSRSRHSQRYCRQVGQRTDNLTVIANRQVLPTTRDSVTHKFRIMGHEGYLTLGLFDSGQPGEIFIKMAKEGSTLSGLVQGFCRAFSLALQYGLPLHEAVRRFKDMRFEPMGATSNPDIPEVKSIIDYVARYLEHHFVYTDGATDAGAAKDRAVQYGPLLAADPVTRR